MEYHIFKKSKTKNGKKITEWYYWYWNFEHTRQIQKACKGCIRQDRRGGDDHQVRCDADGSSFRRRDRSRSLSDCPSAHERGRQVLCACPSQGRGGRRMSLRGTSRPAGEMVKYDI